MEETVDILLPPTFDKAGIAKTREQAWNDGDWLGTFNLWVVQSGPTQAIVYQQRSPNKLWAPGCLDVTVGGHYLAGESITDGLREAEEEIGKRYRPEDLTYLGRKIHVGRDSKGRIINNVVNVFLLLDNSPISTYMLQADEVYCVCVCPIEDLIKVHTQDNYSFAARGILSDGTYTQIRVSRELFPYNWDNYHFKMALLARRFIEGEQYLIY